MLSPFTISPFRAMEMLAEANRLAAERPEAGVIQLTLGQPSAPPPPAVRDALVNALETNRYGYTDGLGIPALRRAIAAYYQSQYGLTVDSQRIAVTMGASGAFLQTVLACFRPGDRIALAEPCYPAYRNLLLALGMEPVLLPASAADRFQPTAALLEAAGPVQGLLIASPSNPTGTVIPAETLRALAAYCDRQGIWLLSDEIYHGIYYGAAPETALRHSAHAVVLNSFSKYFRLPGFRLGWAVLPENLLERFEIIAQNLLLCPPSLSQYAALAVFDHLDDLDREVRRYADNRALLLERLPRLGITDIASPDGAFYLYADIGHLTNDSLAFCRKMLEEIHVAAVPGVDFDSQRGSRFIRFSFAGCERDIAEALTRMERWLA